MAYTNNQDSQISPDVMLCEPCRETVHAIRIHRPGCHIGPEPRLFKFAQRADTWRGAHHTKDGSFLNAVQGRCYICYMINRACPKESRQYAGRFRSFYKIQPQGQNRYLLKFVIELHHSSLDIKPSSQVIEHHGIFKILPKADVPHIKTPLRLTESTGTEDCGDQVHRWLEDCTRSHKICNEDRRTTRAYQVRLLRVAENCGRNIHLQTFAAGTKHPKYATLSHCWNYASQSNLVMLKRDDMDTMHSFIDTNTLPRKFQDAIKIARWLKVEYLWIDALCIVQDSIEDWKQQSAVMGDIYAGSYCNIAATNADRDGSCFHDRPREIVEPFLIKEPTSDSKEFTHVIGYDDIWCNSLLDTTLHSRAWVLQERLLSARTVHFGQEQMFWECRDHKACEAYPSGIPRVFSNSRTDTWRHEDQLVNSTKAAAKSLTWWQSIVSIVGSILQTTRQVDAEKPLSSRDAYASWSEIVERYMQCDLSRSSDKLVAIRGIANNVKEATKERYVAGLLYNESLPLQLLWHVSVRRQADGRPSIRHPSIGISGYRAPSWSWASVDARIAWNWPSDCDKSLICFNNDDIVISGDDVGTIDSAQMTISGSLYAVRLCISNSNDDGTPKEDGSYALVPQWRQPDRDPLTTDSEHEYSTDPIVFLDTSLSSSLARGRQIEVYLLPICLKWRSRSGRLIAEVAGLIVQKCPTLSTAYERIGVFGLNDVSTYMGGCFKDIMPNENTTEIQSIILV